MSEVAVHAEPLLPRELVWRGSVDVKKAVVSAESRRSKRAKCDADALRIAAQSVLGADAPDAATPGDMGAVKPSADVEVLMDALAEIADEMMPPDDVEEGEALDDNCFGIDGVPDVMSAGASGFIQGDDTFLEEMLSLKPSGAASAGGERASADDPGGAVGPSDPMKAPKFFDSIRVKHTEYTVPGLEANSAMCKYDTK